MPPLWKKDNKLRSLNDGKLWERLTRKGFSYRPVTAHVLWKSSKVMWVSKKWSSENRTTRKTNSGLQKVTSAFNDQHGGEWPYSLLQALGNKLTYWYRDTRLRIFVDACRTLNCVQGYFYRESLSQQTINGCIWNGLMSTEPDKLIVIKFSFEMNDASVCGILLATMPVNVAF